MKSTHLASLLVVPLALSISCSLVTNALSSGDGPAGLTAHATSPLSAEISWSPVEGAQGYRVLVEVGELGYLPIAELGADQTMYEDLMAPANRTLKYRVQTITSSGEGGSSNVTVTTPPVVPDPLTVQAEFDASRAVTQTIGVDGGNVSLEDRNGTYYQLHIPAGVLGSEVAITLTPISVIGGWPLDGELLGGVRIEPEDIALYEMASLTIGLVAQLPTDGLAPVGFAFDGTGQEFHLETGEVQAPAAGAQPPEGTHLARPAPKPKVIIVVPLQRTGSQGAGRVSPSRAAEVSRNHPPSDAGARSDQQLTSDEVKWLEGEQESIANHKVWDLARKADGMTALASDCRSLQAAVGAVASFEKAAAGIGGSALAKKMAGGAITNLLADKVGEITGKTAEECKKSRGKSAPGGYCAAELISNILHSTNPFFQGLHKAVAERLGKDFLQQIDADLKACRQRSYTVSGGKTFSWSGTICRLEGTFELSGKRPNGSLTITFHATAGDPTSGSWEYTSPQNSSAGTEGGFGTYTVVLTDTGGLISIEGKGTLQSSGAAFDFPVKDDFNLTPIERCDG